MSSLSARIVRAWYGKPGWLWLLSPLSVLFLLLSSMRRRAFSAGIFPSWRAAVPVIVVGNITVGGTGKTPLVVALVERLKQAGYRPGIASRGYGGKPPFTPYSVGPEATAGICGDEPLLLARRTGVPVVVDSDRAAAGRCLVERHRCDVLVTDDGLQHYGLQRDIEIVVIDSERGLGNGMVLPVGPLREPAARLRNVDFVVANGGAGVAGLPGLAVTAMTLRATSLVNVHTSRELAVGEWSGGQRVHAVAGIGHPQRFFDSLEQLGFTVIPHPFGDHHHFVPGDIAFNDDLPVLMTEKDAVKCRQGVEDDRYWFLSVDAVLDETFFETLIERLRAGAGVHPQERQ